MEPRERPFLTSDPAYQVKSFGILTEDDLHIFIPAEVLDGVLTDAAAHVDKLRAGALVGGCYTDGRRRFVEIEGAVLLMEAKPPAVPFALEEAHHDALAAAIAARHPGAVDLGYYFTHPRLGLYLSRSETATLKNNFDLTWAVTMVCDPVADKFSFFVLRDGAPVKSGFHIVTRNAPRPVTSPMNAPPKPRAKPAPKAETLTREELFRLATEEAFKDGHVDADENRTLQVLGGLLKLDADTAIRLAKQARKKFKEGQLQGGRFDALELYRKAHELAMADGELEADEAQILASLRSILKLSDEAVTAGGTPRPNAPKQRTLASSFTKLPVQEIAAELSKPTTLKDLLCDYAGLAFDRQCFALDRLGEHDFSWDLDAGFITLAGARYRMQALGTTSEADNSWSWAWAPTDQPLPAAVTADSRKVQNFGKSRSVAQLTTPVLPLAGVDPNELALVASGLTNAHLYYRIPFEGGALYVLVNDPSFGRSTDSPAQRIPQVFRRLLESVRVAPRRTLISYMRAFGLEVTEEPTRVVGRLKGEAVAASFDAAGKFLGFEKT